MRITERAARDELVNYFNESWLMPPPTGVTGLQTGHLAAVLPICLTRLAHK